MPPQQQQSPAPAPAPSSSSSSSNGSTTGAAIGAPPADQQTLNHALSTLVGGGAQVQVSFEVSHDPNEIVTVFRNAQTGQVISQFPAETMVLIAQFFNKVAGGVVDSNA